MARKTGYIYAYTTPAYRRTRWRGRRWGRGLIKVGYTQRDPHTRIREQIGASSPEKTPYTLPLEARAQGFTDKDVHRVLREMGVRNVHNEWFEARERDVRKALKAVGAKSRKGRPASRNRRRRRARQIPRSVILILALAFIAFAYDPARGITALQEIAAFLFAAARESFYTP